MERTVSGQTESERPDSCTTAPHGGTEAICPDSRLRPDGERCSDGANDEECFYDCEESLEEEEEEDKERRRGAEGGRERRRERRRQETQEHTGVLRDSGDLEQTQVVEGSVLQDQMKGLQVTNGRVESGEDSLPSSQDETGEERTEEEEKWDEKTEEDQTAEGDSDEEMKAEESVMQEFDDERLREEEESLTEEERERRRQESMALKEQGNTHFKSGEHTEAERLYTEALGACPVCYSKERAVLFSNRGAARLHLDLKEKAIADCSRAIELNPEYLKAILRRAELYEKTDKLDEALEDYKNVLEKDPGHHAARQACMRLPRQIEERNEKLKEEMMGKLKDLGNMFLRPFGLSTNNFQVNQDSNTGSYSINFVQNSSTTNNNNNSSSSS